MYNILTIYKLKYNKARGERNSSGIVSSICYSDSRRS